MTSSLQLKEIHDFESSDCWNVWHRVVLTGKIGAIECKWNWVDQGWGNRKGGVRIKLKKGNMEYFYRFEEVCDHNETLLEKILTIDNCSKLIKKSAIEDELVFEYIVGGGGGHSLVITDAEINIRYDFKSKSARK